MNYNKNKSTSYGFCYIYIYEVLWKRIEIKGFFLWILNLTYANQLIVTRHEDCNFTLFDILKKYEASFDDFWFATFEETQNCENAARLITTMLHMTFSYYAILNFIQRLLFEDGEHTNTTMELLCII